MPKKNDEQNEAEKLQELKRSVAKQVNDTMCKALKSLHKELNGILKSNKMWYCDGELIKDNPEMQTSKDRNADQMVIDHFTTIADDMFAHVEEHMLWTSREFAAK